MQLKVRFMALLWQQAPALHFVTRLWQSRTLVAPAPEHMKSDFYDAFSTRVDDDDSLENGFELSGPATFVDRKVIFYGVSCRVIGRLQ